MYNPMSALSGERGGGGEGGGESALHEHSVCNDHKHVL